MVFFGKKNIFLDLYLFFLAVIDPNSFSLVATCKKKCLSDSSCSGRISLVSRAREYANMKLRHFVTYNFVGLWNELKHSQHTERTKLLLKFSSSHLVTHPTEGHHTKIQPNRSKNGRAIVFFKSKDEVT